MEYYVERGYVPEDIPDTQGMHRQGAAMTLEYAWQDWCLAQLARPSAKPATPHCSPSARKTMPNSGIPHPAGCVPAAWTAAGSIRFNRCPMGSP